MMDDFNEFLKQRPYLGGVVFVGMVLGAALAWAVLQQPAESVPDAVSDPGLWVVLPVLAPLLYVAYVATARQNQ